MNNTTIVSHRVRDHSARSYKLDIGQKHHWAASLAAENEIAEGLLRGTTRMGLGTQMKPNPLIKSSGFSFSSPRHLNLTSPIYPQDGAVWNGTMSSTKPVTVQFYVDDNLYLHFDMRYQTTEAQLRILLEGNDAPLSNEEDTEEYDWAPMMRQFKYRPGAFYSAHILVFIYARRDDPMESMTTENIHYLYPFWCPLFLSSPSAVSSTIW